MDIARLPIASPYGGLPTAATGGARARPQIEPVVEVLEARRVRDPVERVVAGEVLRPGREETFTTREHLRGRGQPVADGGRRAVGAYLAHQRDTIEPDAQRGRAVDYFI